MGRAFTRREFIKYGTLGLGTLAAAGGGLYTVVSGAGTAHADDLPRTPFRFTPFSVELPIPPTVQPATPFAAECAMRTDVGAPKFYGITMEEAVTQIIPGVDTRIWGYNGLYPGPTFRVKHGEPAVVRFTNHLANVHFGKAQLDVHTLVHNHGGHQSSESDGSPVDPAREIHPHAFKDFCYPNMAPINSVTGAQETSDFASTQWYHDHFMDETGRNVYMGLAGFYLLADELEQGLVANGKLPAEARDIPLVIQDKVFASDGSLLFQPGEFDGVLGDVYVVNGKARPRFHVDRRKYRFRILNGADARWLELRLSSGAFLQIGNDSWLLPYAIPRTSIRLAPAERADVILDFRDAPAEVFLANVLEQTDGRGPDEVKLPGTSILKFIVGANRQSDDKIIGPGGQLRPHIAISSTEIVRTRRFEFDRSDGHWVVNERDFDPNRDDATPKINTAERWILKNGGGGWAHPIHIHLEAHQVQRFNGRVPPLHNSFKKDTTALGPDDEAEVFIKFRTFTGKYVFHCHNLQHEDRAMMGVFEVKD